MVLICGKKACNTISQWAAERRVNPTKSVWEGPCFGGHDGNEAVQAMEVLIKERKNITKKNNFFLFYVWLRYTKW